MPLRKPEYQRAACVEVAGSSPLTAVARRREAGELTARMQRLMDLPGAAIPSRAARAAEFSTIDGAGDPGLWSDARRPWEGCSNVHATV